jgi:hypothetical protein
MPPPVRKPNHEVCSSWCCRSTVGLLGAIFTYAVRQGIRINTPVHGVIKFAESRRQRRLTDNEYRLLGMALSKARHDVWPPAIGATRLMILTGWRRGEVLGLRFVTHGFGWYGARV